MDYDQPYQAYKYEEPNLLKRYRGMLVAAAGAILLIIVILGILHIARTGTLELTSIKGQGNITVTYEHSGKTTTIKLNEGEKRHISVAASTIRVSASGNVRKSVDIVTIKGRQTTKLTVPQGEQRGIQQLGSKANICPLVTAAAVYSFGCGSDAPVTLHTPAILGNSINSTLLNNQIFGGAGAYKNGSLGFQESAADDERQNLSYIDFASQTTTPVNLPSEVMKLFDNAPTIVTDPKPNSSHFALVFYQVSKIFLFQDTSDTHPVVISPKNDYDLSNVASSATASFSPDGFIISYTPVKAEGGEGATNSTKESDAKKIPPKIQEYGLDGKLQRTLSLPEKISSNTKGVFKVNDNYYLAEKPDSDEFLWNNHGTLESIYSLGDVSGWALQDNTLYVQANFSLYQFTPGSNGVFSLRGVYNSKNIRISSLYPSVRGLVFTAYAGSDSDSPLNIYQLLPTPEDPNSTIAKTQVSPVFRGFSGLQTKGLTAAQLDNIKYALCQYVASTGKLYRTIKASNILPDPYDPNIVHDSLKTHFSVSLDGEAYRGTVEYKGQHTVRVTLTNLSGQQIFDSQDISPY